MSRRCQPQCFGNLRFTQRTVDIGGMNARLIQSLYLVFHQRNQRRYSYTAQPEKMWMHCMRSCARKAFRRQDTMRDLLEKSGNRVRKILFLIPVRSWSPQTLSEWELTSPTCAMSCTIICRRVWKIIIRRSVPCYPSENGLS